MADFITDIGGKAYFFIIHASLFFLGAYIVRKKVQEIENEKKTKEVIEHDLSNQLSIQPTISAREHDDEKVIQSDSYINTIVEWCYFQQESSVRLLFECWLENTERDLRKAFMRGSFNHGNESKSRLQFEKDFTRFPVKIDSIRYCSKTEHELVLKLILHVDKLNVKISSSGKETCYEIAIILEADTYFRTVGSQMAITFELSGKDHINTLEVCSEQSMFKEAELGILNESLRIVLSKTTTLKVAEEKTEIELPVSLKPFPTIYKTPKPATSFKETNLDEAVKTLLCEPVSPVNQQKLSTVNQNDTITTTDVLPDDALLKEVVSGDVFCSTPLQSTKNLSHHANKDLPVFTNSKSHSDEVHFPVVLNETHVTPNIELSSIELKTSSGDDITPCVRTDSIASAGDEDEDFLCDDEELNLASFTLKPLADFKAIQGSLEKTFYEENNNAISDGKLLGKPDIVIDTVSDISTSQKKASIENGVCLREPKILPKNPEARHSFHHGQRPKLLVNTTSVGNLTTESHPPLRSSVSQTSLNSAVGSLQYKYSALIIENEEKGEKKYYHIPPSMAKKGTYSQKGQKLHVYNDHIFVATHFTGIAPTCCVCNLPLRRLGKQGYSCRDCKAVTHKRCHFLTTEKCPSSTLSTLNIEYIGGTDV